MRSAFGMEGTQTSCGVFARKAITHASPEQTSRMRWPVFRLNASVVGLVFSCLFWGISFPLMQMAIDSEARCAGWSERTMVQDLALRATYNGWRFVLATALYGLVTFKKQRGYRRVDVRGGVAVGPFFTGGLFF